MKDDIKFAGVMKKYLTFFTINFILFSSVVRSQSDENNNAITATSNTTFRPYVAISISPFPSYLLLGQLSLGFSIEKSKMESSVYLKTGVALESFYYSSFLECDYLLKRVTLKNQNELDIKIPLWFAYRNYRPFARGEEHAASEYFTMLNVGTGVNIKLNLGKRISIIQKSGVGIGPKYIRAGDFQYTNFEYQGIAAFPNLDLAIVLWLNDSGN